VARYRDAGLDPFALVTVSKRNLDAMPALTDWLLARRMGFRYSLVRDLEGGDALLESTGAPWRTTTHGNLVPLGRRAPERRAPVLEGEALERVQRVFERCYRAVEAAMPVRPSFRRTHRFCDLEINRPLTKACGAGDRYLAIGDRGTVSPCQAALHHEGTAPLRPDTDLLALAPTLAHLGRNHPRTPNDTCAACRFKHSCAGGCPLLLHRRDGDLHGRSPYCEVFRFVLPKILRIAALEVLLAAEAREAPTALAAADG
jgi:radical SAM protein with 4Fe4S-binding SPASM domain